MRIPLRRAAIDEAVICIHALLILLFGCRLGFKIYRWVSVLLTGLCLPL